MNNERLAPPDKHSTMMSVADSRVIPGSLWKLLYAVPLYGTPGVASSNHVGNCIIVVLDVVRSFKFGPHVRWVRVLSSVGTGYINRVHFNSDGATVKCI